MLKWLFLIPVLVAGLILAAGRAGLLLGQEPSNPGVKDGKLKPPSRTPNSVSSQASLWPGHEQAAYAQIDPLPLVAGDGAAAERGTATLARLQAMVAKMPGAAVVRAEPGYFYASFTTPVLRFVDDAEFWFDPVASVIQVRSASRIGRKDFGVNRQRIETLRQQLAAPAA